MINDLVDLDRVLDQYDAGRALVGPVLNLSINSSFRFFYIAGNGGKIYQSIGLGFIEAEPEAERQRGDIVAKLQSRFGEVTVLDNLLEMARAANRLWPKEETARFLATAALEAGLQPDAAGRDESLETRSETGVVPGDHCKQAIDETPTESVTLADAVDAFLSSRVASASGPEPGASAAAAHGTLRPLGLPDVYATWPLNADPDGIPKPGHAALEQDDVALAVLRLKSPPGAGADTGTATVANAQTSTNRPLKGVGRSTSIIRFFAFGAAAALIAGIIVLTSTRRVVEEASPGASVAQADGANDRSQTTGSVTLTAPPNQIATSGKAAAQPPAEAAEIMRSQAAPVPNLQSEPSPAPRAQNEALSQRPQKIGAPHVSQSPPSQIAETQVDAPPASVPSQAVNTRAARPPDEPSSPTPEAPRAQAAADPGLAQSPSSQRSGAQVASPADSEPQSRPSPTDNAQAATATDTPASRAPDAPPAQARAAPGVTLQSPAARVDSTQATPASVDLSASASSPAHAQSGGAAIVSEAQTPPSRMASAEVGTPPVSTPEPPAAKAASVVKLPLSADELDALLSRSSGFLKTGDFAAARILLRRAAESGSADAALMLAKTFDPIYLNELGAMGIQPDIAQARHWYQQAVELGSDAAAQRLANLAQKGQ
jgi:hypothetical protein